MKMSKFAIVTLLVLAGCSSSTPEATPVEPGALSVTHWTDRTELFMEYPPLVAGTRGALPYT